MGRENIIHVVNEQGGEADSKNSSKIYSKVFVLDFDKGLPFPYEVEVCADAHNGMEE